MAHRLIICAALANGETHVACNTTCADIEATVRCLAALGAKIESTEDGFSVRPAPRSVEFGLLKALHGGTLDCGESGSTLRFMLPVAMALKEEAVFLGSGKLPDRPISPLKEEMEAHGCSFYIDSAEKKSKTKYREICTVRGRLRAGEYSLAGNISSQFITGLLFALPLLEGDSVLRLTTELESSGYVDMTLDVLRSFGIEIGCRFSGDGLQIYEIPGRQRYTEPESLTIEGDWSNASFWLVCGALGGPVTVKGLNPASTQADKEIVNILSGMGADVLISDGITVSCSGRLKAAEVSVAQTPDMVPVLAVAMAAAKGASMITNAERLKLKESDRLKTVYDFLSRLGADITYGGSGLSLTGVDILNGGDTDSKTDPNRFRQSKWIRICLIW